MRKLGASTLVSLGGVIQDPPGATQRWHRARLLAGQHGMAGERRRGR
jgi:hypothetical protein